jgi:ankyrin repeat domain-containing protein 50
MNNIAPLLTSINRLSHTILLHQPGQGRGTRQPSSLLACIRAIDRISTSMLGATAGPAKLSPFFDHAEVRSQQAMPSNSPLDPQPLNPASHAAVLSSAFRWSGSRVCHALDERFCRKEPELAEDYNKQLPGNATTIADISNQQCIETALKKLLEDREKKQWKISFLGHNMKI